MPDKGLIFFENLIRAGSTFLQRDSPSPPPWRLPLESLLQFLAFFIGQLELLS